jgi:hypothetical protein
MCAIGRYDTTRQPVASMPSAARNAVSVQSMFSWSSITPFGGPVVPDV